MDIGRNEPCRSGSGKKFKRCCGAPKSDPLEVAAGALRGAQSTAKPKLFRLLKAEFGKDFQDDAWADFDLTDGQLEAGREEAQHFYTWVLYDWEPWEEDPEGGRRPPTRKTSGLA